MKLVIKKEIFLYFLSVSLNYLVCFCKSSIFIADHDYETMTNILKRYSVNYPKKTHLYTIGKSLLNKEIWVLAIADSNPHKHIILRPEVKFIGNTHVQVKENLIRLIDYMLNNQTTDSELDYVMKNTRLHILLAMNPDGFFQTILANCASDNGRYNVNNFDLNKNFPDAFECQTDTIQPESQSIIKWINSNQFILSANFLGGTHLKYKTIPSMNIVNGDESDYDVFDALISSFRLNEQDLKRTSSNCNEKIFYDELNNMSSGGTMHEFNYMIFGCYEIILQISCCQNRHLYTSSSISNQNLRNKNWNENRKSLINYIKYANRGIRGIVMYADGQLAENLTVRVDSRKPYFKTNRYGEYYRILLPGIYKLEILINCDSIYETVVTVPESGLVSHDIILTTNRNNLTYHYDLEKLNRFGIFCNSLNNLVNCSIDYNFLILESLHDYKITSDSMILKSFFYLNFIILCIFTMSFNLQFNLI